MKKLILAIIFVFCGTCSFALNFDMNLPVAGKTIANEKLQAKVLLDIYKIVMKKHAACDDFSILNSSVIQSPTNIFKSNGNFINADWKEYWRVKACNYTEQIPVSFYIRNKKAIYVIEN